MTKSARLVGYLVLTRLPWAAVGEKIQPLSAPEWFHNLDSAAIGGTHQLYALQLASKTPNCQAGLLSGYNYQGLEARVSWANRELCAKSTRNRCPLTKLTLQSRLRSSASLHDSASILA
jgi:hypothetical protein